MHPTARLYKPFRQLTLVRNYSGLKQIFVKPRNVNQLRKESKVRNKNAGNYPSLGVNFAKLRSAGLFSELRDIA